MIIGGVISCVGPRSDEFKIKIGLYDWSDNYDSPELTWRVVNQLSALPSARLKTGKVVFQDFDESRDITNPAWIKNRWQIAETNKDYYDFGIFLLDEEIYKPNIMKGWIWNEWSWFRTEPSFQIEGINILLLKDWYISKYGYWNQTWWNNVIASNNIYDPILNEWCDYYMYQLVVSWHKLMERLSKKSAVVGGIGTSPMEENKQRYWGADATNYILKNYDLAFIYSYPQPCEDINVDEKTWRATKLAFNGTLVHILTSKWTANYHNCTLPWSEEYAWQEFVRAAKYSTAIMAFPCTDFTKGWNCVGSEYTYVPYLIKFRQQYEELNGKNKMFVETFDKLDLTKWRPYTSEYVESGELVLSVPNETVERGVKSILTFGYGTYKVRFRITGNIGTHYRFGAWFSHIKDGIYNGFDPLIFDKSVKPPKLEVKLWKNLQEATPPYITDYSEIVQIPVNVLDGSYHELTVIYEKRYLAFHIDGIKYFERNIEIPFPQEIGLQAGNKGIDDAGAYTLYIDDVSYTETIVPAMD